MNLTVGLSLLFCLVASTSAASTYQNDEQDSVIALLEGLNLNDILVELIEQFKTIMPCGIPSLGVPALVPFELNHTEFKIDKTGLLYFDGEINELLVDDLNNFDVVNVDLQIFKLKLDFSFLFHSIKTTGQYKAQGKALSFIPFNRGGKFGFNFNGLSLVGSVKVALNGDKLLVEEFKLYPTVKSVNSKFEHVFFLPLTNLIFNKIVESVVPKYLRDNQEEVSSFIESFIKPEVNNLLGDYTLEDLMGLLQGENGNGTFPSSC
ncbi:uncharacterized protein LOC109403738 [Aedes albopictus]|uniref:Hemolymph juvenile hormone binding protein n=1 Tax=Aedes albopictus TaxID=7160 RepID=A0ABM1Y3I1_AEDAL